MALSDHVVLTITQDSANVARAGFGVPLILSSYAAFVDRVRTYNSIADVAVDFSTTTPEYRAASAMFSQSPRPESIKIGRAANKPTLKYSVNTATVRNSYAYTVNVVGEGFTGGAATYTSDSAATAAEINNGLLTAINAISTNNYLAAFAPLVFADAVFTADNTTEIFTSASHGLQTGDGPFQVSNSGGALPTGLTAVTDYWAIRIDANTFYLATSLANALAGTFLTISTNGTGTQTISDTASTVRPSDAFTVTGDSAGEWFSLEILSVDDLTISMTHADPGVATDLDAILLADGDWYALYTLANSNAVVLAAAAWVEANKKIYIADTSDSGSITLAVLGSDTLDDLHTQSYGRTMGAYHPDPSEFFGAAWLGKVLPLEPGSETWKFKTLSGISAVSMTATHRTNLVNKKANSYQSVAGLNITWEGTTSDGDFLDVTRGLDWLEDDMTKSVFEALAGASKIPYTDKGVSVIEGRVRGSLKRAIGKGILADDPEPVVTVPKVADVSTADKTARILRDVKFSATLAGAIHKVIVTGTVSA